MKVAVEFRAPQTLEGLKSIVEQWESQFPQAKAITMCAYGTFTLMLEMPPATQVIPPQLVDARGEVE